MKKLMMSENAMKLKGLAYTLSFAAMHEDYEPDTEDLLGISHIINDISEDVEKRAMATSANFE